jgi:hypothetical protein
MTLREKAAQIVWPSVFGDYVSGDSPQWRRLTQYVEQEKVGGFTISVGSPTEVAAKLNALQSMSKVPLVRRGSRGGSRVSRARRLLRAECDRPRQARFSFRRRWPLAQRAIRHSLDEEGGVSPRSKASALGFTSRTRRCWIVSNNQTTPSSTRARTEKIRGWQLEWASRSFMACRITA